MSIAERWHACTRILAVRTALVVIGFVLMILSPLAGVVPGPGGILVFAAGLALVLRYSDWAKRKYVRFKRRHPKKGDWADWGLRRPSAARRRERQKAAVAGGDEIVMIERVRVEQLSINQVTVVETMRVDIAIEADRAVALRSRPAPAAQEEAEQDKAGTAASGRVRGD